jgi:hypothetical protein
VPEGSANEGEDKVDKKIDITYDASAGLLKAVPDPQLCSVKVDQKVRWSSDLEDWRVVFGPEAPVYPKVADPKNAALKLKGERAEDLRHVKYVIVAWTDDGLKHLDPELIVEE